MTKGMLLYLISLYLLGCAVQMMYEAASEEGHDKGYHKGYHQGKLDYIKQHSKLEALDDVHRES